MDPVTLTAPDPGMISGTQRGEFGPQQMEKGTVDELSALEARINDQTPTPQAPVNVQTLRVETPKEEPKGVAIPENVQVPEKFKTPEGNLDAEKLEKSLVNLEHYVNLEREASRLGQPQPPPQQAQQFQQPQPQYQPQYQPQFAQPTLEQRVSEDLQRDPGTTVVNLMRAAVLQAEQQSKAEVLGLRRKLELMEIAAKDPGIYTREGANKIEQTLKENPWLWASPTPFASAYRMNGPISPSNGTQATAPQRRAAPILPGGQAPSIPSGSSITSEADLRRHLESRMPNDPMSQANHLERIIEEMAKNR